MSSPVNLPQAFFSLSTWSGFTRLSKGLAVLLVSTYVLSIALPSSVAALALLPGRTIPFGWNLVTAAFFEHHVISLVINVLVLLLLGRILEPLWGTKEFLRFIILVGTFTSIGTFFACFLGYYMTMQAFFLYEPISGFHGVLAGFLVAIKQLMPEQEIVVLWVIRLRAKWLPSLTLVLTAIVSSAIGGDVLYVPFIVFGIATSWTYLRFYQPKSDGSLLGDPSNEFAFATFFPEFMQPFVQTLANVFGRIFCGRRLQQQAAADIDSLLASNMPLPGSDPADASRRRERGARALEERLAKAAAGAATKTESSKEAPATANSAVPPTVTSAVDGKREQDAESIV